ncbi:invasion antigen C [Campylobacter peloridis]|uniref:Invasion antigen C n=1 Tax=Campylobacter peloridis TaxID=488546 RepID=A0A5C7DY41_9BACT|nr:invasion antigen C [Campylobacter peloridis]AJC84633.1 invasion antigen C [Campylobacter peloridis LMG 23910]MBX1886664.1 invasion antigen C [Campylobacter peloridis]MBX2079446.1 invasion antigen C [Campylobacter peloridis]QOQ88701.1 invasion antigen C [Campylobacter peloridis]TXE81634.1 invasion antigen C [Campylobacter peloridis]
MQVNEKNSPLALNNITKIKEKNTSSDEFQATLNALKNKEEKEYKKESDNAFSNTDLNIGEISKDFSIYAWEKLRQSKYQKNEENILNNLFKTLDKARS